MSSDKQKHAGIGITQRAREQIEDELEAKGQHVLRDQTPKGVQFVTPVTATARAALGPQSIAQAKKQIASKRRGR